MSVKTRPAVACSALLLVVTSFVPGSRAGIPDDVLRVRVTSATASAAYTLTASQAGWALPGATDEYQWRLDQPITLFDPQSGQPLAQLAECELYVHGDPCLSVSFSVTAGDQPISVEIDTGVLSFAPLDCAHGYVSAALTLRDDHGDGAVVSGATGPEADRIVWAIYNDNPPEFKTFASLLRELSLAPGTRVGSMTENAPDEGVTTLAESVSNMQVKLAFQLSANACVTGSAFYELAPSDVVLADMNCDGVVDFTDVDGFVLVLNDDRTYRESYPACCGALAGDLNGDGVVDLNDIDSFVECLLDGGC